MPDLDTVVFLGTDDWERLRLRGDQVSGAELRSRMNRLKPADPINIQYTSGTTGSPKGATLSHRNIRGGENVDPRAETVRLLGL